MSRARVLAAGATNVGMKRTHNEDNLALMENNKLYVVADGMGGHASGEVASRMAIDALQEFFHATGSDPEATWPYKIDKAKSYEENRLITAIKLANLRIYQAAQRNAKYRGMGTTVACILVIDEGVLIAHVGDSRVYRYRNGTMECLTEDHSLLNDYIKMKNLSKDEIANFPHKNVIVRALGMKDSVKVDTALDHPQAGDIYLLCSDGLSGAAPEEEVQAIVSANSDLQGAVDKLIQSANQHGGPDNITVILSKIVGLG